MIFNYKIYLAEIFVIFFFVGCSHPVSKEIREGLDPSINFESLIKDPNLFLGKRVLLGGMVVFTRNIKDGTELEVVQKNLGSYGSIEKKDYSGGRFIFFSKNFLEPEIYASGRELIGVGKVTGQKLGKVGNYPYNFPVIEVEELHLLENPKTNNSYPAPYSFDPWYRPYYFGRYLPYYYR